MKKIIILFIALNIISGYSHALVLLDNFVLGKTDVMQYMKKMEKRAGCRVDETSVSYFMTSGCYYRAYENQQLMPAFAEIFFTNKYKEHKIVYYYSIEEVGDDLFDDLKYRFGEPNKKQDFYYWMLKGGESIVYGNFEDREDIIQLIFLKKLK